MAKYVGVTLSTSGRVEPAGCRNLSGGHNDQVSQARVGAGCVASSFRSYVPREGYLRLFSEKTAELRASSLVFVEHQRILTGEKLGGRLRLRLRDPTNTITITPSGLTRREVGLEGRPPAPSMASAPKPQEAPTEPPPRRDPDGSSAKSLDD